MKQTLINWSKNGILLFLLLFLLGLNSSPIALAKDVVIKWKPIKNAVQYELEVELDGKLVSKARLDETRWNGDLGFGIYSYKVRAFDRMKRAGKWSLGRTLVVMPPSPELSTPIDKKTVPLYDPKASMVLKWKKVPGAAEYLIQLKKGNQVILTKPVQGTQLELSGLAPGEYIWTVSAMMQPNKRAPASIQGKKWISKPSDPEKFFIEHQKLEAPIPVAPLGVLPPLKTGEISFEWKKVNGAEAYQVTVTPKEDSSKKSNAKPSEPKTFTAQDNSLIVQMPGEGKYTWEVRALANMNIKNIPEASGPKSVADFHISRSAAFEEGSGYIAVSTMVAPYTYQVSSPGAGGSGKAASVALTTRLSGEYWYKPQWAVAVAGENTGFSIQKKSFSRIALEANLKYRIKLSSGPAGWFFYPKVGVEAREYFKILPQSTASNALEKFMTLGPSIGFDIRKQLTQKVSLGLKTAYFYPIVLSGVSSGGKFTKDASYRNFSLGIQTFYWLAGHWGLGGGAYIEMRSISYLPNTAKNSAEVEKVYTDGSYFFGSLIYSFGR